jgi:hypothetical protein
VTFGDPVPEGVTFGDPAAQASTTQQQQQPNTSADWDLSQISPAHLLEGGKGFVKGAAHTVAGLASMYGKLPGGGSAGMQQAADWLQERTKLNNPDQQAGNVFETIAEFLPLGLEAGGEQAAAHGGEALEAAPKVSQTLSKLAKRAKVLEDDPDLHALARVALKTLRGGVTGAARGAVEQGAQTAVKTGGDPEATAEAMKTGAEFGGPLGAVGGGGAGAIREVAQSIENARPATRNIAGTAFETLGNKGTNANLLLRNLGDVSQDPATQAVDEASGNIGKTAVANSANRTNAMRPVEQQPLPPARQLPGGGGFNVAGEAPTETPEGELLQPAAKRQQAAFKQPSYVTSGAPRTAMEGPPTLEGNQPRGAPEGTFGADVATATPREPRADTVSGPGTLILTDQGNGLSVPRARQQLAQWDRILNDPDQVEEMGPRAASRLTDAHADLANQLSRYDDFAAGQPHIPAADPLEMVRNTHSIGDAAEQLKAHNGTFWQTADDASNGKFTQLREEEKWLRNKLNSKTPIGNLGELQEQLAANQQAQMDFFDKYKTSVSPQEWDAHRSGYQDGIVLQNLHDLMQREFNGITPAEQGRGVGQRVFQPGAGLNQKLEDFYNGGFRDSETNRDVLRRTIGQQHMDDLKTVGQLFDRADRREATQSLLGNVATSVRRHASGIRGILAEGGGVGMLATHHIGAGLGIGALPTALGTVSGIRHWITDQLISDPAFLKSFTYAVQNGVPARTAGPLLAARMGATAQNLKQQQQQQQDQQQPQDQQQQLSGQNDAEGTKLTAQALRESTAAAVPLRTPADVMTRPLSPDLEDRTRNQSTTPPLANRLKAKAYLAKVAVRGGNENSEENQQRAAAILGGR